LDDDLTSFDFELLPFGEEESMPFDFVFFEEETVDSMPIFINLLRVIYY